MPRHVPAPPVEEESELVKELENEFKRQVNVGCASASAFKQATIEIVKRHEKLAKSAK